MTEVRATAVIGVDWGTSTLRAYRLADDGRSLERREAGLGILAVPAGDFGAALERAIGDWVAAAPHAAVVLSGMIGSRQGWVETPYLSCPAGAEDIAKALTHLAWRGGRGLWVAPGLQCRDAEGVPDVMRGEEVQILGALATLGPGRHRICLPGTHSKWVGVADGRILGFATYMTGEVYDVLRRHSILGRLMTAAESDGGPWFAEGLARSGGAAGLLHQLFGVRARRLAGEIPAEGLAAYLSGLLIGHEVAAATTESCARVHVIGAAHLLPLYRAALERRGIAAEMLDPDIAARGLFRLGVGLTAQGSGQ